MGLLGHSGAPHITAVLPPLLSPSRLRLPPRALDSFQKLLREKAHCMAHPDALISAVGTKVYEFEGGRWEEDKAWSATLDQGWSVEAVRETSYKALAEVRGEGVGGRGKRGGRGQRKGGRTRAGARYDWHWRRTGVLQEVSYSEVRAGAGEGAGGRWEDSKSEGNEGHAPQEVRGTRSEP